MSKDYYSAIKQLRIQKGLSQSEVAQKMGIPRTSYVSFERGNRGISLTEAAILADMLGISLEEIESGIMPNYEKYKQMILAFLRLDGKITKTKLAKLLYFADFGWFYNHLESMSGMQYRKLSYGPVSDTYFRLIDEMSDTGEIDITQTKDGAMLISQTRSGAKLELSTLNTEEKKLIRDIEKKWKDKKTADIVSFTHKQFPYLYAKDNEIVSYGLFTQENPDEIF
ncbi:MAG: helix-turn-helix domain-containing protein [bacterium]|nr:helix-turn-helix domain-containing protein [bacterium]